MSTRAAVWAVWGVLSAAALVFIGVYGRDCPYMDEWMLLPALAGDVDLLSWAWAPHSEHRYPIPRLLYVGLYRLTGDLRGPMAVTALLLAWAAAGCVRAARRVRGYTSLADLFFPLAFLHAGHWENLLMGYQLCFALTALLGTGLLCLATDPRYRPGVRVGLAVGRVGLAVGMSVLLAGCGAAGLFFAAAGAAWLVALTWDHGRRGDHRAAWLTATGAVTVAAALALVAAMYPGSTFGALARRPADLLGFAAKLTATSFGPAIGPLWPVAAGVIAVAAIAGLLAVVRGRQAPDRMRGAGLGAVAVGSAGMVAGLTWGRGWAGPDAALMSRYAVLLLPGAAAVVLIAIGHGGRRVRRVVPAAFAGLALVFWPLNLAAGLDNGARISRQMDALTADVRDGLPAQLIGERYDWQLFLNHPGIDRDIETAARAGLAPFRVRGSPRTLQTVSVTAQTDYRPGSLHLDLPAGPADTIGVRIRGEFVPGVARMADYRVRWHEAGTWHEERFQVAKQWPATVVVRVSGAPRAVEIIPDCRPVNYRVNGVDLVVAEPRASSATASAGSR